jgi:hypothetical protein
VRAYCKLPAEILLLPLESHLSAPLACPMRRLNLPPLCPLLLQHHMPLSPAGGRGGGPHGAPPRDYRPRHLDLPGTSAGGGRDERRHAAAALEARVVPYGVKLPAYSLVAGSAEYREVERRHSL